MLQNKDSFDPLSTGICAGIFTYVAVRAFSHSFKKLTLKKNLKKFHKQITKTISESEKRTHSVIVRLYDFIKHEEVHGVFLYKLLIKEKREEFKPQVVKRNPNGQVFDMNTYIMDLGPKHLLIYNKYMVFPEHLLIVTRESEEQAAPLTFDDIYWTWNVMSAIEGLSFYNSSSVAGASVDHKHLQIIKRKYLDTGILNEIDLKEKDALPFEHEIKESNKIKIISFIGFAVICIKLREISENESIDDYITYLQHAYVAACQSFNSNELLTNFNLIFTKNWMLVALRKADSSYGVSMNALTIVGSFLFTSEAKINEFRSLSAEKIYGEILLLR